jgi:hypothetical protein
MNLLRVAVRFAPTPDADPGKHGFPAPGTGNYGPGKRTNGELRPGKRTKGDSVYIGGGVLALIIIVILLVWLL